MKKLRLYLMFACLLAALGTWLGLRWLAQSYDRPYAQIEDGLYVGSAVPQPPPGTTAVVNLCGIKDRYTVDNYLWEPVFEAGKEPDLDWLRRVVVFIDTQRRGERTTYIHCLAGVNRSGAAVTAYLMYKHGWSRDEALAFVQARRPQIQPNPTLMRLLADWERECRKQD